MKPSRKSSVSEVLIFPEMIEAGIEELHECQGKGLKDEQTVICVFLAMQGFLEMQKLRGDSESVH